MEGDGAPAKLVEAGERPVTPLSQLPEEEHGGGLEAAAAAAPLAPGERWRGIYRFCLLNGPCALYDAAGMEPGQERADALHATKVLVIGAGGLGCELLKDLALTGFTDINVIDCDHIDLSNLNRQFLFRRSDVGSSKAEVAARFINSRVPGCHVVPHTKRIEEFPTEFYAQFQIVISGLDAIAPRRWINSTLCGLVQFDADGNPDPDTVIPLIDGGTEGFKGQARVIFPMVTTCFECALDAFPPQVNFPLCTLAETPRLPEHCVEWASVLQWPEHFPDTKLDGDNPEHLQWVFEKALTRAEEHDIGGVTYQLAMGVVKRIIPAVASTNAVIAAACSNEAFKIATYCGQSMGDGSNYMQFNGTDGLYVFTFEYERKPDCLVCSHTPRRLVISRSDTVAEVLAKIVADPSLQLKTPSLRSEAKTIYMRQPASVEVQTRPNLEKPIVEFCSAGSVLNVTDPSLPYPPFHMLMLSFEEDDL